MQTKDRYRELLAQQQESGLTIKEFCSNQGIALPPFIIEKDVMKETFEKRVYFSGGNNGNLS